MNIKIENLSKSYEKKAVLRGVNLEFQEGKTYCLIGKNGSGKSTLFNILGNLIQPDQGEIKYNNKSYDLMPISVKQQLGFMGEVTSLIEELTAHQYLNMLGLFYKISKKELNTKIPEMLRFFFDDKKTIENKKIQAFSSGMKKKIEICGCLLHSPNFLILDEPFTGLDVVYSEKLIEFFEYYKSKSNTILFSSHNLNYIEKIKPDIIFLDESAIKFQGTIGNFLNNSTTSFHETLLESLKFKKGQTDMTWL